MAAKKDLLEMYIKESKQYPLLSEKKEIEIAKEIEAKGNQLLWAIFSAAPSFVCDYLSRLKAGQEFASELNEIYQQSRKNESRAKSAFAGCVRRAKKVDGLGSIYSNLSEGYLKHLIQSAAEPAADEEQELKPKPKVQPRKLKQLLRQRELVAGLHSEFRLALNKFIMPNQGLIMHALPKYRVKISGKAELIDLIQEGNFGLFKAAESFDYSLGYRFSTYAGEWIRAALTRYTNHAGSAVWVPDNFLGLASRARGAARRLAAKEGLENPTPEKILKEIIGKLPRKKKLIINQKEITPKDIAKTLSAPHTLSLDSLIPDTDGGEHSTTLLQMQEDFASTDPEEEMAKTEASQKLEGLTALLSEREQDIITRRFYNDETLKSIGKTYGVSRERIRQLEAIALDKLRIIMEVREKV